MEIIFHYAAQNVKSEVGPGVAHVTGVVDGRSAGIPCDGAVFTGTEELEVVGNAVVDVELGHIFRRAVGGVPPETTQFGCRL